MTCDLERVYGALAAELPQYDPDPDHCETFVLSRATVPRPPRSMRTDRIHVALGVHLYGGNCINHAYVSFRERGTARHLGLAIVGTVLHRLPATAEITLTASGSPIVRICAHYEHLSPDAESARIHPYWARPEFVRYWPDPARRHPDVPEGPERVEARITNEDDVDVDMFMARGSANTLTGFGSAEASVWLASVLLDLGAPNAVEDEVVIENDAGFGGVTLRSCELTFTTGGVAWWPGFRR